MTAAMIVPSSESLGLVSVVSQNSVRYRLHETDGLSGYAVHKSWAAIRNASFASHHRSLGVHESVLLPSLVPLGS